eukprot:SAG31_NODE_4986_length_2819_cov_2.012868_1_plen_107_part_10
MHAYRLIVPLAVYLQLPKQKGPDGKYILMPSCSAAIDWHFTVMIEHGMLNAYAMNPEAVWMPNMGPDPFSPIISERCQFLNVCVSFAGRPGSLHPVTGYRRPSNVRV